MRHAKPDVIVDVYDKGVHLDADAALLAAGATPYCQNVEFSKFTMKRAEGLSSIGAPSLAGYAQGLLQYVKWDNRTQVLCITNFDITVYKYGGKRYVWSSVYDYIGPVGRRPSWTQMEDYLVFTDNVNPIVKYDGVTFTEIAALSTVRAKKVLSWYSHLVLFGTTESGVESPSRAKWSDAGDMDGYSSVTAGQQDMVDTKDVFVNAELLGDQCIVYKTTSIWGGVHTGVPRIFYFAPITQQIGLLAAQALVVVNASIGTVLGKIGSDLHFFLGTNGVYLTDGVNFKDISEPIKSLLFGPESIFNVRYKDHCVATYVPDLYECWLAIPVDDDVYPTMILQYSLKRDTWRIKKTPNAVIVFGQQSTALPITWDTLSGRWSNQQETWDELLAAKTPKRTLVGTLTGAIITTWRTALGTWASQTRSWADFAAGFICAIDLNNYEVNETLPEAYYITREVEFQSGHSRILSYWIRAKGSGQVKLDYSHDRGETWIPLGTRVVDSEEWATITFSVNQTLPSAQFKVTILGANITIGEQKLWRNSRTR